MDSSISRPAAKRYRGSSGRAGWEFPGVAPGSIFPATDTGLCHPGSGGARAATPVIAFHQERALVPEIVLNGKTYPVDEDGFLQEPGIWNDEVAGDLATTQGLTEMSEEHWRVVRYLRDYWLEYQIAPMVRKLCKETGFKLTEIYQLFPSGPAKGACKVAGLPKPTGCV
jgi:TusE/DsrC/DsvC family sulfur relay protein